MSGDLKSAEAQASFMFQVVPWCSASSVRTHAAVVVGSSPARLSIQKLSGRKAVLTRFLILHFSTKLVGALCLVSAPLESARGLYFKREVP